MKKSPNTYVCAFRGRRDSYQAPLALSEAGLLEGFITDFYAKSASRKLCSILPQQLADRVLQRYHPDLGDGLVRDLPMTALREFFAHRLLKNEAMVYEKYDPLYGRKMAKIAFERDCNLLAYTPYAHEAFTAHYDHVPEKVLFQFHPHGEFEHRTLTEDFENFPFVAQSYRAETCRYRNAESTERVNDCWRHATKIVCASSFTLSTLRQVGLSSEIPSYVTPYGVDSASQPRITKPDVFRVLFVGSGIQRKGLHHLIEAWKKASLPSAAILVLICRTIDPGILDQASRVSGVQLIRGVSGAQLQREYESASVFAMPSLVEGFGQVYLEALSRGCPVLGTENSALPDFGTENDGVFLTPPGSIDELKSQLEHLADVTMQNADLRESAYRTSKNYCWRSFRQRLITALTE